MDLQIDQLPHTNLQELEKLKLKDLEQSLNLKDFDQFERQQ
jgi:hypothetical protein